MILGSFLLTALMFSTNAFAGQGSNTKTMTMTLQGTKVGTETSTTVNPDGSVTLSANCDPSHSECASATIETTESTQVQHVDITIHDHNHGDEHYHGVRTPDMLLNFTKNSLSIQFFQTAD